MKTVDQPESNAENNESRSRSATDSPLVFISHDSRDNTIAEAFANLLHDVSGGILRSFHSSGRKGTTGIDFGTEWYRAIMEKLDDATDVVALLTPHSMDRPWILYESGFAKGKLNTTVLGLAIGIPLDQVATGPFAQFQNCSDDKDSLTDLVLQLVHRHSQARPRDETVRLLVGEFLKAVNTVQASEDWNISASEDKQDNSSIARLFEEVKILVRNVPDQVSKQISESFKVKQDLPEQSTELVKPLPQLNLETIPRWIEFKVSLDESQAQEIYEIANPKYEYDEEVLTPLEEAIKLGRRKISERCVIEEYPPHLPAHFDMSWIPKETKFSTLYDRWRNCMNRDKKDQYLRIDWWSEICNQMTLAIVNYRAHEIKVPLKSAHEESTWYLPVVTDQTVMPTEKKIVFSISLIRIPKDGELIKIDADKFLEDSKL